MFDYFTPITGTIGGSMIGLAAASLLLLNGNMLGASGIMHNLIANPKDAFTNSSNLWSLAFLTTFFIVSVLMPQFALDLRSSEDKTVHVPSPFAYAVAGLLVGFGSKIGNGCTSGHGVCGLGRRSPRSFTAVLTFMVTAIITSILTSPTSSLAAYTSILRMVGHEVVPFSPRAGRAVALFMVAALVTLPMRASDADKAKVPGAVLAGGLFAGGLAISGMVVPSKLYAFLNAVGIADGTWDPTLLTVLGSAAVISFLSYQFVPNFGVFSNSPTAWSRPLRASTFQVPTNRRIDFNLIFGEAIFGIGWALGLLCPGPALYHMAVGNPMVLFRWMPAFVLGSVLGCWINSWH